MPYLDTGGDGFTALVALVVVNGLIWAFGLLAAGNAVVWPIRWLVLGLKAPRHGVEGADDLPAGDRSL